MRIETARRFAFPVLHVLRRLLPGGVRKRIRQLLFEWLDMTWPLASGVKLRIAHYGDWVVYNEVFVNGEYDAAIAMALDRSLEGPLRVLDLGANVGYFSLRVVDRLRQRGQSDEQLRIIAVEADDVCGSRYEERVRGENGLAAIATLVRGAAGERAGRAMLHGGAPYCSHISAGSQRGGFDVAYVDLSIVTAGMDRIDLLKCDIEGSEEALIANYPDLFQKVQMAVFEFHRDLCDVERCLALLREYGFANHVTFRHHDRVFTYGVWR